MLLILLVAPHAFSFDFKEHLKAKYEGEPQEHLIEEPSPPPQEDVGIYWHQVPVWPKDENRRTQDLQFSATRGGLISYTNLFSGRTMFLIMPAISAEHLPAGETKVRMGSNFSSVFQVHDENGYAINADYEITEVFVYVDHQLSEKVDLGLLLRGFHHEAGRADKALDDFHDFFGLPTGQRGEGIYNQYSNRFTQDGKTVYETKKNRLGLGDAVFLVKLKAIDESKNLPTVSVLLALKAPTGDHGLGYTSDSWDPGLGAAFSKQLTRELKAHLNIGVAVPGHTPHMDDLAPVYSSMAALEYYINKWLSMVVQTNYSTSPFARYDFDGVNADSWTGGIGFHIRLPNNVQLHVHFTDEFYNNGDTDYVFGCAIDLWSFKRDTK